MKTTFNSLVIATTLCSTLLLSSISFAENSNAQNNQGKNFQQMSEKKLAKLTTLLNLSASQQTEFKILKQQEKTQMKALKPAMKTFKAQVKMLMSAEVFDEAAFRQLQVSNQEVFSAMALIKAKSKFAMKSILTGEQLEKFRAMKHKSSRR